MKKLFVLLLALVLSIGLIGCSSDPLVNAEKAYYVTGQFAGWGEGTLIADSPYMMEAIAKNDDRVDGLDLKGVEYLYLLEITLSAEEAGWSANYIIDDVNTTLDGNLTVKIIRTLADDYDSIDWWAQSPESGEIANLTPETLFIPEFLENATTSVVVGEGDDAVTFTSGAWNDNPAALAAGTYYAVFAKFDDGTRGLGLVVVE